jgi:hypothetical protein
MSVSLPHSGASHFNTWQVVRMEGTFGSRRSSIRSSLPWPHHLQLDRLSWVDSLAATASSFPTTLIVVARRDALNGYKVDLARMEGCNHWVGGGPPRGLIPPWRSLFVESRRGKAGNQRTNSRETTVTPCSRSCSVTLQL